MFTPKLNPLPMGIGGSAVLPPGALQQPPANTAQTKAEEQPPESRNFRAVHYNADHSGCGLWRMSWPAHLLNYHNKAMVVESTVMITDPNWYFNVKAIRLQRQATNDQK